MRGDRACSHYDRLCACGADRVAVTLTGEDGNVFNVIGLVSAALCDAGQDGVAAEFRARAFGAHSYDEVLSVVLEFCEVD